MFSLLNHKDVNSRRAIFIIITSLIALLIIGCSSTTDHSTQYPDVTITQPDDGETITTPSKWIKADVSSEESIEYVNFIIDGEVVHTDSTPPWEYNWSNFYWADGNVHSLEVTAYDMDGIPGSDSISVTVSEDANFSPTLLEPADSVTVQNPIEFKWESLPDAVQYDIIIGKVNDSLFTFLEQTADTILVFSIPDTAGAGLYGWKVQAQNIWTLWSEYSPLRYFTLTE
ncbi:MAG: Ig-like domain-containing protein [Candidatus Cloacimonadota bacterium]|nr:Ig-like domain-containing protein [Candidatus Cloacimonadota bacterium]